MSKMAEEEWVGGLGAYARLELGSPFTLAIASKHLVVVVKILSV